MPQTFIQLSTPWPCFSQENACSLWCGSRFEWQSEDKLSVLTDGGWSVTLSQVWETTIGLSRAYLVPSLGRASCWLSPSSVRQWRRSDATCGTRRLTPRSTVGSRHEVSLGSAGNLATAADSWESRVVGPALGSLLRR